MALGVASEPVPAVLVGHQDGGELGSVLYAAAANGHDEVRAIGLALVHQLLRLQIGGLRRQVVQNSVCHAGFLNPCHRQFQQPGSFNSLVRKNRQMFYLVLRQNLYDPLQRVFSAEHRMGHFQFIFRQHAVSSF